MRLFTVHNSALIHHSFEAGQIKLLVNE